MVTVSRNAPCPCGSGKKYKRCCNTEEVVASAKNPSLWLPLLLCVAAIGAGVFIGIQRTPSAGLSVAVGAIIIVGIVWVVRRPPPPKQGGGDPGAINFGS